VILTNIVVSFPSVYLWRCFPSAASCHDFFPISPVDTFDNHHPLLLLFSPTIIITTHHRSQRQARMEEEHQDMLEKLNKIRNTDFDNTKRIERPEEILERRRREREARNVWYRRWGRWITGQS
jgi:hypothetical protein